MSMAHIVHGTLVAGVVTTVQLDEPFEDVEVLNRSGSAEIYFRLDGVAPTVGGTDCQVVPASISGVQVNGITSLAQKADGSIPGSTVKLISSGTPTFTVSGS
jgi:hypothetical protein